MEYLKLFFTGRKILICREITKFYEEYFRSKVSNLKNFENNIKGEITVVISEKKENSKNLDYLDESDKKKIKKLIKSFSLKDIVSLISEEKNISKKLIYNYCLKLKNEK